MTGVWQEEQRQFYTVAYQFAQDKWLSEAAMWDRECQFPSEALRSAAELGFAALYVRPEYGGSGVSRLDAAIIFEALSQACVSTAAYLSIHNMVAWLIDSYAEVDLCRRFLPALASMDILGSYCLTEPNAGSDAAALSTTAKRDGEYYVVNGAKAFISGGGHSDIYVCMVRTGEAGPKGITCLLIEKDTAGIRFGEQEKKLGWHSQPTSMVYFDGCRVPVSQRIGEEGQGFKMALSALNGGRVNIGACSLGGARACLQAAKNYLSERKQFGKALMDFQALQFRVADLWTELSAAQLMVHQAARAIDGKDHQMPMWCAMAKRYATDVGFKISDSCLQFFGGYGYLQDYPIERFFRDLRVHQILEGTNEVMRMIVAREILKDTFSVHEGIM